MLLILTGKEIYSQPSTVVSDAHALTRHNPNNAHTKCSPQHYQHEVYVDLITTATFTSSWKITCRILLYMKTFTANSVDITFSTSTGCWPPVGLESLNALQVHVFRADSTRVRRKAEETVWNGPRIWSLITKT